MLKIVPEEDEPKKVVLGGKLVPLWEQEYDQQCNPLKPYPGEPGGPMIPDKNVSEWWDKEVPKDQHGYIKAGAVFEKEDNKKASSVLERLEAIEKINEQLGQAIVKMSDTLCELKGKVSKLYQIMVVNNPVEALAGGTPDNPLTEMRSTIAGLESADKLSHFVNPTCQIVPGYINRPPLAQTPPTPFFAAPEHALPEHPQRSSQI